MTLRHGIERGVQGFMIEHTVVKVMFDVLALLFYTTHFPEKWWPHTFDLWVSGPSYSLMVFYGKLTMTFRGLQGASHQIFHILIDVGQLVFLLGLQKVMLGHSLHAGGPVAFQSPDHTSLSM